MLPGTELAFENEVRCETGILFAWRVGHKVARFRQVNKGRSNIHGRGWGLTSFQLPKVFNTSEVLTQKSMSTFYADEQLPGLCL